MNSLDLAITLFIILETANVFILYFKPDSKKGNGVAIFKHWEESKKDENSHLFASYMTNWVAGTKLIFILLLITILLTGSYLTKILAVIVLIIAISTSYFRLYPIIKKLDQKKQLTIKGYSKTLNKIITSFITVLFIALLIHIIIN